MCAVCLEKDCATGVRKIYPAGSDTPVWVKANSPTGIQTCSKENLKADAPCKMGNGILAQLADNPLHFDGIDTYGVRRTFDSQISPCADLNLLSKPSPDLAPVIKAPIHNVPTPAAPNYSVADKKGIIISGVIGSIIIIIGIGIVGIRGFIWKGNKLSNYQREQDRGRCQGKNRVPPHDTEHCDEITIQMQPLNAEVANGNVNGVHREDGSVGTAGLLGHCDDYAGGGK
ncbi:uncharacterized protein LOC135246663 [Anguilla rostrata]|uniref:uncharacterized protein LOC135246663 n=1 Tax=Anguilla rostrata TaxID=7938 RepID=UPI0030D07A23